MFELQQNSLFGIIARNVTTWNHPDDVRQVLELQAASADESDKKEIRLRRCNRKNYRSYRVDDDDDETYLAKNWSAFRHRKSGPVYIDMHRRADRTASHDSDYEDDSSGYDDVIEVNRAEGRIRLSKDVYDQLSKEGQELYLYRRISNEGTQLIREYMKELQLRDEAPGDATTSKSTKGRAGSKFRNKRSTFASGRDDESESGE